MSQVGQRENKPQGIKENTKEQTPSIRAQEVEEPEQSQESEDEEEQYSEEPEPQPQAEETPRKGRKKRPNKFSEQGRHSLGNEKVRSSVGYTIEEPDSSQGKALTRHQGGPPAVQLRQGGQVQGNQQGGVEKKSGGMPSVRLDVNLVS
jgi:hypothetical protein